MAAHAQEQPAFPGAEGFGAFSAGGRGGQVLAVTTLEDYHPNDEPIEGSLRAAVTTEGPRTVIFRVAGIIELKAPLVITEPRLTLAGQTAPGDGICLKGFSTSVRETSDIVIRHLRFRPGDEEGRRRVAEGADGWETDALSVYASRDVIIDHCSTGWANDEVLSLTGVGLDNITVQWTLITESLHGSTHPKGSHGYGSIVGGHATGTQPRITMHHTLYAHHWARNPHFAGDREGNPPGSLTDFRNNVIYDWGRLAAHNYTPQYTSVNFINNYLKPGPSTREDWRTVGLTTGSENANIYARGNRLTSLPEADDDNWLMANTERGATPLDESLPTPAVSMTDALSAYEQVLERAGAWPRDAVDARVVGQVREGAGRIIDSAEDVGGWPTYAAGQAPPDSDGDGMPDEWENARGLDPNDAGDAWADRDGDGWANLEEYLSERASECVGDDARSAATPTP
ncbi:MAG: pectate lyase [Armatimonadota bacterium]